MAGKNVEGQLELFSLFDSVEELEQKIKGAGLKEVQGEPVMEQCYRHRDTGETAVRRIWTITASMWRTGAESPCCISLTAQKRLSGIMQTGWIAMRRTKRR